MEAEASNIAELIANGLLYLTAIIGAASLILQGVAKITKITPSTKDDEIVSKVEGWILSLQKILDRVALNPSKAEARDTAAGDTNVK